MTSSQPPEAYQLHTYQVFNMSIRIIDPSGDFHLQVFEANSFTSTTFLVSRSTLENHSTHDLTSDIRNSPTNSLTLYDVNIPAMETILRILHGVLDINHHHSHNTNTREKFDQESIATLYHILDLGMKWFKTEELEPWFSKFWTDRSENEMSLYDMKVMLYPSYIFRHAEAFARITKSLVFEWRSGEMHGLNPLTGRAEFRFEHRILKQLVRLKTRILEREVTNDLLDPLDHLCNDFCEAGGNCMVAYNKSLRDCLVIPSIVRRNCSIRDILESEGVNFWNCASPPHASEHCSNILSGKHVVKIKKNALNFWEGMCIECVLRTSGGHINQEQFWEDGRRKRYGTSCPIPHNYQTWNYSYMGPFELMSKHIAEQKEREKNKERTRHGMKFSAKSRFPYASDSPKRSRRRSSVSFSTPDEYAIQQQQKIAELTAKNGAAKMKNAEASTDSSRLRTQDTTRSFNTSSPKTPSRKALPAKFATSDETARLQQNKIAEWTARNLANQARIRGAEEEAKAETEAEAAAGYTDAYFAALEFYNDDHDNTFVPVNTPPPPAAKKDLINNNHTIYTIPTPMPKPSPTTTPKDPNQSFQFPPKMHAFNSIPVNKAAPKNDWIAQRLAFYNSNREGALAHQRMVNGETAMDLDASDEEL
ncbi:uncharacterized protein Bfra_011531ca [Botrytis fragariae]|uniref:Uncharacterized protein n=1 Tax=Botrytis fragariae TaxID=1964551 RepID=A0A8H6AXW6_9HELO|nr:uncharacterized protein Bfra_011531ca [Botrytis fragariae]KAF5875769.1 hypothetical protein Bfra_011531ca [Botrytis fragariae]